MKVIKRPPQTNGSVQGHTPVVTAQTESARGEPAPPQVDALTDDAPARALATSPSRAIYQPQRGKLAQVDLKNWHPRTLRETHLRDAEIVYRMLKDLPPAITFYGGARIKEDDPFFALSREMGALLAKCGVPVRTGAGPGMMTSVLEGFDAQLQAGGVDPALAFPAVKGSTVAITAEYLRTQGFRIALPFEQEWSNYVHVGAQQELFPLRKQALRDNARGLVSLPGGYGTLDEMFEGWALSGLGEHDKPMVIVGKDFYAPLLKAIEQVAVKNRALVPAREMHKPLVTDSPQELVDFLRTNTGGGFEKDPQLRYKRVAREIDETIALLDKLPPAVTFIGGRALTGADPTLGVAEQAAALLTKSGVALRVGGLAEVAGAVARGAREADAAAEVQGLVVGSVQQATAQPADLRNVRVHQALTDFVAHKECIGRRSRALVALPGGMGTLSELFAVLTQVQCRHLPKMPIVLVGKDYWQPIFDAIKQVMLTDTRKTIAAEDLDLVTITDDPQEVADIVARAHADGQSYLVSDESEPLAPARLFQHAHGAAPTLPPWLSGAPDAAGLPVHHTPRVDEQTARELMATHLPPRIVDMLGAHGVDARDAAYVLMRVARTPESGARKIATLLAAGAGAEAFKFLVEGAPYTDTLTPIGTALAILERWGKDSERVFADLALLATSTGVMNPDALKVALQGVAAPGPAGETFAGVVTDAVDLLRAGHKIYLDEMPGGAADLIDATAHTAYRCKRVTSTHLGAAVRQAARELTGDAAHPGAPAGFRAVAQLDARGHATFGALSNEALTALLQQVEVPADARLDAIHLRLDDRTVVLDRAHGTTSVIPS